MAPHDGFVGVKNLHIAPLYDVDTLDYGTPVDVGSKAGLVSIKASRSTSTNPAYANDNVWINAQSDTGGTGSLVIRDLTDQATREFLANLAGYMVTTGGSLLALTDRAPIPCAIMCEQTGYIHGRRKALLKCEFGKPDFEAQTKEGNVQVGQIEIPFTFEPIELAPGAVSTTRDSFYGDSDYNTFFNAVNVDATEKTYDVSLSALSIGNCTLSPTFAANKTVYTTSTTNASDAITATATSSNATVEILNGSTVVENTQSASWVAGANTVKIKVRNGVQSRIYTVTVTKS